MSRINELIRKLCPNGVEYKKVWQITTWDKKYNSVDKYMQPKIRKYNYLLANQLNEIIVDNGDVFILETGINNTKKYTNEDLAGDNLCNGEIIAIPWGGTPNVKYYNGKFVTGDNRIAVSNDINVLNTKFLYYIFENKMNEIADFYRGSGIKHPEMKKVLNLDIPVPPIKVQEEIVRILDKFGELEAELEVELEVRKSQYEFWRGKLLNEEYETKYLPELSTNLDNKRKPVTKSDRKSGEYPYYGASGIVDYVSDYIFDDELLLVSEDGANLMARSTPIAFSSSGKVWINNHAHVLKFNSMITQKYVEHYLNMIDLSEYITGAAQPKLNQENLNRIRINIPSSIEEQEKIVIALERFDRLINDISVGLPVEISLRRKQYEYYRDKLLSFEEYANE